MTVEGWRLAVVVAAIVLPGVACLAWAVVAGARALRGDDYE